MVQWRVGAGHAVGGLECDADLACSEGLTVMRVIRPMGPKDLDALLQLVLGSGHGLTSLPKDPNILLERLEKCERSFRYAKQGSPQGEDYFFALEDQDQDEIIGVSGIYAKIGGFWPAYFYESEKSLHKSDELNVANVVETLHLKVLHNGPSEICSLYLHPQHRKSNNGRFLSLARFLFMADHQEFFEPEVFAEMRGMVDENGMNPFWSAVGRKFFKIDFTQADYMSMVSKKWIQELLPDFPLCINLLPLPAQLVIGRVHPNTIPAYKILRSEGFYDSGLVGVLEPGPVLMGKVGSIRSIKNSTTAQMTAVGRDVSEQQELMISNCRFADFRSCLGSVKRLKSGVALSGEVAHALEVKKGDSIRFVSLR